MADKAATTLPEHSHTPPDGRVANGAAVNMLTADLLIVDELLSLPSQQELQNLSPKQRDQYGRLEELIGQLLAKRNMGRGDKISIDADEFTALSVAVAGLPAKTEPGGATADVLTTMKHLLGDKMNADFIGIAGRESTGDQLITHDISHCGIALHPGASEGGKAATSFIFTHADGKRSTITYPGNASEKLHADAITDAHIAKSDTVFLPISLWSKFDKSLPEALLQKSIEHDKQIVLSIPKQARFGYSGTEDLHKRLIPQADVIAADEAELARLYKTGDDVEHAIQLLQVDIAGRDIARAAAGKPARSHAVSAFIKHKDDSATVLVSQSPPGVSPLVPATRYEIPAPPNVSPQQHNLGVDDAMYAGFISALQTGMTPDKAGQYAMEVGQTKFLYDSVRIPSPVGADKATQQQWSNLRSGLSLTELESAISYAKTGVSNSFDPKLPRTPGQKAFDLLLYPLVANIGVLALSTWVTYHSNFNQNKANAFVKRSSWFKDQLAKIPGIGKSQEMVRNLNMVAWSFIDGSIMAPVVGAFESKRQDISRAIDETLGTTPEDTSVYEKETKRNLWDVLKARATTFGLVIATYFALNAKVFPHSMQEGILTEAKLGGGLFERQKVQSINGMVFDVPGKKIGGWLSNVPWVKNWAEKTSNKQLAGMAAKTGTVARKATEMDTRYQIEGVVNTGIFEAAYTSLCTAGLYFLGKAFATRRAAKEQQSLPTEERHAPDLPSPTLQEAPASYANAPAQSREELKTKRPAAHHNHLSSVEHSRTHGAQLTL